MIYTLIVCTQTGFTTTSFSDSAMAQDMLNQHRYNCKGVFLYANSFLMNYWTSP